MNHKQYFVKALKGKDLIMADTCFLMDPALETFLTEHHTVFEKEEKKIYIPPAVHQELARKVCDRDPKKAKAAMRGSALVSQYGNVFTYARTPFTEEELLAAFADNDILSVLTANRCKHKQLIITNDSKLSRDILKRNTDESVIANPIDVFRLDGDGMIRQFRTNEVRNLTKQEDIDTRNMQVPVNIPSQVVSKEKKPDCMKELPPKEKHPPVSQDKCISARTVLGVMLIFGVGIVIGKYGGSMEDMLKVYSSSMCMVLPSLLLSKGGIINANN